MNKEEKQAHVRAASKYNKRSTKTISFRLNLKTDASLIAYLSKKKPLAKYLKALIEADMRNKDE